MLRGSVKGSFQGPLQAVGDLPFIDYQDQLPLPSTAWFPEPLEVETRQCLCLHVTAALTGERSLTGVRDAAVALGQEMLQESVEAFAHLGDAPPHVSEAEAFVRHNAHDCFYPHHEKDYRAEVICGFWIWPVSSTTPCLSSWSKLGVLCVR